MDFKILGSLGGTGGILNANKAQSGGNAQAEFGAMLKEAVGNVVENQKVAEAQTMAVAQGEDVPMQDVVRAVAAAELSLQTLVTVRDRAVEAYQQIQQMPI